jgi:hypothetical protein
VQKCVQASPLQGLTEAFPTQPIDDEDCTSGNMEHTYLHVIYCLSLVNRRHRESSCSDQSSAKKAERIVLAS